jgi:hypothetical protein
LVFAGVSSPVLDINLDILPYQEAIMMRKKKATKEDMISNFLKNLH